MRDFFIKDWGWKLFSLFLAVTIWLTVHRILEPEENLLSNQTRRVIYENMPVHIVSSTGDVSFYHVTPAVVKVTVSGPTGMMDQLQASQIHATVDLTGKTDTTAWRETVNVYTPPDVTLIQVEPAAVIIIPPIKSSN
jgi:YbbR domain-containing protein